MSRNATRIGYLAVGYLVAITALVFLAVRGTPGTGWLWALDSWSHLADGRPLLYASGMLAFGYAVYRVSQLNRARQHYLALGMLSVVSGAATWYLRLDRSLGDRTIFLEMLTHRQALRMSQPLTTATYAGLHAVTQIWDWPPRNSIALGCSLAAIGGTVVLARYLAHLPKREAFALSLILPSSGLVVLFFGYVESTVLAVALDLLFLYLARKVIVDRAALWKPSTVLALAVLCHGLSVYLIPSLLLLTFWTWRTQPTRRQRCRQVCGALVAFAIPFALIGLVAVAAPGLIRGRVYGDSFGGEDLRPFVPLLEPRYPTERYTLFSMPHLADLANVSLLVCPFSALFLLLAIVSADRDAQAGWYRLLYAAALSGLAMAFLWNPDLGMQSDWDLFGPLMLPLLLLGALLLARQPRLALVGFAVLSALNSALLLSTFGPVKTWSPAISALPTPETTYPTDIEWVERFELIGFDASTAQVEPGAEVTLTLYLRGLKPMPVGYTLFLHLVDTQGRILSQDDHQPYPPTEYWPPGETYTSAHTLPIPYDAVSGSLLEVRIGAYFYRTLERLPIEWDGDLPEDRAATLISFSVGERLPANRHEGAARVGAD